ncbi:hypothetical protein AG4045_004820, partial [Apium graveolens]
QRHAFTLQNPFPNGNKVGTIIKLYSGTIRNLTSRALEVWSMLVGFRRAFLEREDLMELETDSPE